VALDDDALQAEQGGPVVLPMVHPLLEAPEHRHGDHGRQLGEQTVPEFLAQESGQQLRQAFRSLQRDIADEAITDDDVGFALVESVTFDIADKIQAGIPKQFGSALDDVIALDLFLTDVEDPDRRSIAVLDRDTREAPMIPNCSRCSGTAIDVGAQVEHVRVAGKRRQDGADRRPVDAGQHFQDKAGNRHQRAGIAGRNAGIRLALLDQIDGDPHRRVFLVAERQRWRLIHGDHFAWHGERQRDRPQRRQERAECVSARPTRITRTSA
jgi:hypothetical protein